MSSGQDVAVVEREVHSLRQRLIRTEAELSRREALAGTRIKLEKELAEVNGNIKATTEQMSCLQTELQELQKKLLTTPESPTVTLRKVFEDEEVPVPVANQSAIETHYQQLIDRNAKAKRGALRIALRLLGAEVRDVIRRCREDDPSADVVDIITYILHHPSLMSGGPPSSPKI